YSTFFGGTGEDEGYAIAVNYLGNPFIAGNTYGITTTTGAAQTTIGGASDGFATEFATNAGSLVYSTYMGGLGLDQAYGIALSPDGGMATVVGQTSSSNYPTSNALYGSLSGTSDAFVTRFKPVASAGWTYSTYLGGSGTDQANGVAVDPAGSA